MNSFLADELELKLFHGSRVAGLSALDVSFSDPKWPFGTGIYMSAELDVARTYARVGGALYSVCVGGERGGGIGLDRSWDQQSYLVATVGARLFKQFDVARPHALWGANARSVLDAVEDKAARNVFLAAQGIWLMRGHLDAMEVSGLGDRGCQFLLLNPSFVVQMTAL